VKAEGSARDPVYPVGFSVISSKKYCRRGQYSNTLEKHIAGSGSSHLLQDRHWDASEEGK
jgi:hypothetical protein